MASPSVGWQPLPWWEVGLKLEGLEPEQVQARASLKFTSGQHPIGTAPGPKGLEQEPWESWASRSDESLCLGWGWGQSLRAWGCTSELALLLPWQWSLPWVEAGLGPQVLLCWGTCVHLVKGSLCLREQCWSRRAGAGDQCGQSPWQFSVCCLHTLTGSKQVCVLFKSRGPVSYSPFVSPTGFQTS